MTPDEKIDKVLEILNAMQQTQRHHTELLSSLNASVSGINSSISTINNRLDALFHRIEDIENRG